MFLKSCYPLMGTLVVSILDYCKCTALNMGVQISLLHTDFIFPGYVSAMELLYPMTTLFLILKELSCSFLQLVRLPTRHKGSLLFT